MKVRPWLGALLMVVVGFAAYPYALDYYTRHQSPVDAALARGAELRTVRSAGGDSVEAAVALSPTDRPIGLVVWVRDTTDSPTALSAHADAIQRQFEVEAERRGLRHIVVMADLPRGGPVWLNPPRIISRTWQLDQDTHQWTAVGYSRS